MITLFFAVIAAILWLAYDFLRHRPELIGEAGLRYWLMAVFLMLSVVVVRVISFLLIDVIFTRLSRKQPSQLLRLVVALLFYGLSISLILRFVLQADVAALVASTALVTAIIGFALQATLGNLFEGLSIQVHQPFHIGDRIEVNGMYGEVESLTWRAVMVRQEDMSILTIPNNMLAQGAIRVLPAEQPIRVAVHFPAPIDVPPRRIINLITETISVSPEVHHTRRPEVLVHEIAAGDSAVMYEARFFAMPEDELERVEGRIRERIWYALARAGISMPASIEGSVDAYKVPLLRVSHETRLSTEEYMQILSSVTLFRRIPLEILSKLADDAVHLIFAPGETIKLEGPSRYSLFVCLRGLASLPLPKDVIEIEQETFYAEQYWQPEQLEIVRHHLAEYMGPLAGELVRRAARHTSDPYHLYRALGADIPNDEERNEFIALGPESPAREIEPGDFFGVEAAFYGNIQTHSPKAVSEVELLEIGFMAIRNMLNNNPNLYEIVSQNYAHYLSEQNTSAAYHPSGIQRKIEQFHRD